MSRHKTTPNAIAGRHATNTLADPSKLLVDVTPLSDGTVYVCFPNRVPTGSAIASANPVTR